MGLIELFILAVGLSMDAFAVSVCKGLSLGKIKTKHMCIAGAWFGGFQALMPLIGYFAGRFLSDFVTNYSHWIAFILLAIIGVSMIKESFGDKEEVDASMDVKSMFLLAVATSIDALMVGVTFAFLNVAIVPAVLFIGATTFVCRSQDWKHLWNEIQIPCGTLWWNHSDPDRIKNRTRGNWASLNPILLSCSIASDEKVLFQPPRMS